MTQPTQAIPAQRQPQPSTDELLALAAENQAERAALIAATLAAVLGVWAQVEMTQIIRSWFTGGLGARVFVLLSAAQESTASQAPLFVERSLAALRTPVRERPPVDARTFAGIASDGRDLEGLLAGAPVLALQRIRRGEPAAVASMAAENFLRRAVTTQIADAGRAADQVAITVAEPAQPRRGRKVVRYGWVRMLNPPSCSRCVVLAGKFYRWNEGFKRHEMCDCAHIPAVEDVEDDLTTDPMEYFRSLSRAEQDDAFGKANAQAIRDGADISQVVNATTRGGVRTAQGGFVYTLEGATKRGLYGRRSNGVLRPTPWQIYRDAHGDRDEAIRMLRQFKYIYR